MEYGVLDTQNVLKVRNRNVYLFQSARVWLNLTYKYLNTRKEVIRRMSILSYILWTLLNMTWWILNRMSSRKIFKRLNTIWVSNWPVQDSILQNTYILSSKKMMLCWCSWPFVCLFRSASIGSQECCSWVSLLGESRCIKDFKLQPFGRHIRSKDMSYSVPCGCDRSVLSNIPVQTGMHPVLCS